MKAYDKHAFDALLSDEAVEAAADGLLYWARLAEGEARRPDYLADVRAALQAAIKAVTEGERVMDDEQQLARRISAIWGHPGRIHPDARALVKTLILDGWRAPVPQNTENTRDRLLGDLQELGYPNTEENDRG